MNPRGGPWGLELRACGWGSAVEGGGPGRHLQRRELPPSSIRIPALHTSTIIGCNLGLLHPLYPVPGMRASSRAREAIFYLHMECEGHKLRAMGLDRGEQTRTGRKGVGPQFRSVPPGGTKHTGKHPPGFLWQTWAQAVPKAPVQGEASSLRTL